MVGTNATMKAFRLFRSKLRKRDEHHQDVVLQATGTAPTSTPAAPPTNTTTTTTTTTNGTAVTPAANPGVETATTTVPVRPLFIWQYPAEYTLYNSQQEACVQPLPSERPGFCQGFRKNLRGRWRRLVKRKPEQEVYTIPPELLPQLKQIYVY